MSRPDRPGARELLDRVLDPGSWTSWDVPVTQPEPRSDQYEAELVAARERTVPDQWQVQVQAKVQAHADVVVHSAYLSAPDLASAHLGHTDDVAETVLRALHDAGPDSRVCVLPEGPQTIPYVAG